MSLNEVLIDELRDLYSAENQLVKALPKAAKGSNDPHMKQLFKDHLEQTKGQVLRLREVFQHLGKKPTGQHCSGMEGCIKEVEEALEKDEEGALKDAGLVGAALRVEHYEIAGYTAAIALAKSLGQKEIVGLLTETLNEEKTAAKNVVDGAKPILKQALSQEDDEDEDEAEKPKSAKEKHLSRRAKRTSPKQPRTYPTAKRANNRRKRSPKHHGLSSLMRAHLLSETFATSRRRWKPGTQ